MSRRFAYWIAAGSVLLAIATFVLQRQREASLRTRAPEAARRAGAWLLAHRAPFKDPAIPWILGLVNDAYCRDATIRDFVAKRFHEFDGGSHPIYAALGGGFSPATREASFDEFWKQWLVKNHENDVLSAMAYGVYCDRLKMPEVVAKTMFSETSEGYVLTHQYLALQFMKRGGCLDPVGEQALRRAAERIAAEEERSEEFSDLFAERAAVLLYGDDRQLVEPFWIDAILASQEPSGAWSDEAFASRVYATAENPHTTALAFWALAEYSRTCPFSGESRDPS
jgi:hypothetical protein